MFFVTDFKEFKQPIKCNVHITMTGMYLNKEEYIALKR